MKIIVNETTAFDLHLCDSSLIKLCVRYKAEGQRQINSLPLHLMSSAHVCVCVCVCVVCVCAHMNQAPSHQHFLLSLVYLTVLCCLIT
jgi:uncharacterized membrane protein